MKEFLRLVCNKNKKKSIKVTVTIKHIAGDAIVKDATGDIGK